MDQAPVGCRAGDLIKPRSSTAIPAACTHIVTAARTHALRIIENIGYLLGLFTFQHRRWSRPRFCKTR
jgi:hypothetical protein